MRRITIISLTLTGLLLFLAGCSQQVRKDARSAARESKPYTVKGMPNPFIEQRADPWIYKHSDGYYYFTASVPEFDRLEIRRSETLFGLRDAEPKTIWTKHPSGEMGAHIWAPELHFIDGSWYIYFAAGKAEKPFEILMYALQNDSANPLEGDWVERGLIDTTGDYRKTGMRPFALDSTTFEKDGIRYLVWAQQNRRIAGNTSLYIAEMEDPLTIKGEPVRLSSPEYPWEQRLFLVNEGPAVLIREGRVFMTYSASGTDHNYCMGLLTADADSDLLDPESWEKSPEPVFQSSDVTGIYGPGHSCFITDEEGTDLLVYHARSYKEIDGDPLNDPNRHTRIQKILWDEEGMPDFGIPVKE